MQSSEKGKTMSLEEVDLAPVGETIIDLQGLVTERGWTPWGCSYLTRAGEVTPETRRILAEKQAIAKTATRKATRAELVAFLRKHGRVTFGNGKKPALRTSVHLVLHEHWYPRRFVNAAEPIYECSCGYVGDLPEATHQYDRKCPACGREGYLLQLRAMRLWVEGVAKKYGWPSAEASR